MKTPKVEFVYSKPYDFAIHKLINKKYDWEKSPKKVQTYIKKVEKKWRPIEKRILTEISEITGVIYSKNKVICYVNTYGKHHYSEPLTLFFVGKLGVAPIDKFIEILTHECVHLYTPKVRFSRPFSKYSKEPFQIKTHILVNAIMKHLFLKFFGEERLTKRIKFENKFPVFKRAWEIVEKEGYKNIMSRIVK